MRNEAEEKSTKFISVANTAAGQGHSLNGLTLTVKPDMVHVSPLTQLS